MITSATYKQYLKRIDELLKTVGNDTPINHPDFIELNQLSDLVADYEEAHFPINPEN